MEEVLSQSATTQLVRSLPNAFCAMKPLSANRKSNHRHNAEKRVPIYILDSAKIIDRDSISAAKLNINDLQ